MSDLGGSTAPSPGGGVTGVGVGGGATVPGPSGGATAPRVAGGLGAWALAAGVVGLDATAGTDGLAGRVPDGGASLLGRLEREGLAPHAHTDADSGGVIDYARLVVSATAPPAPATPSDAFWLHPTEEA
jgi:hypothetical protein